MIKKRHPKFNVPNYGAKSRKRVKERWRKQRGVDNKKRVKMNMMGAEPTIGYRNPEQIRHIRASGKRAAMIGNVKDFENFIANGMGKSHDAIAAHALSRRTREKLLEMAAKHNVRLANVKKAEKPAKTEKKERAAVPKEQAAAAQKGEEKTGPLKGKVTEEKSGVKNEH